MFCCGTIGHTWSSSRFFLSVLFAFDFRFLFGLFSFSFDLGLSCSFFLLLALEFLRFGRLVELPVGILQQQPRRLADLKSCSADFDLHPVDWQVADKPCGNLSATRGPFDGAIVQIEDFDSVRGDDLQDSSTVRHREFINGNNNIVRLGLCRTQLGDLVLRQTITLDAFRKTQSGRCCCPAGCADSC